MKIKINKKQVINEITEEEYEFVKEALEIPPSELPFSNIFGNRYRVLGNFQTLNEEHPLTKMIEYLEFNGWSLEPHVDKQPLKFTKSYRVIKPMASDRTEIDTTPATRTITLTLQKILQNMAKAFENSLPKMAQQYSELTDQARELNNKISKGTAKLEAPRNWSFLAEDEEEMDALIAARDKIKMKQVALGVKLRNTLNMYLREKEATMPIRNIAGKESVYAKGIIKTVKGFRDIISDEAQMYKWQESFSGLFKPAYVIFSRHPVDVYRMSDFTQIRSCHSPPSRKGETRGFDQYNICALAEAYANGMISYVVSAKEFEDNDLVPTQETLDQYEDEELFYDEERGEGIIEPRSRIRIRRGAYTDPDTGNVTPLAIPDQKIYGLDVGGFKEYVREYIANIQKDSIEKIFPNMVAGTQDGDTIIELDNVERFGGSYEDSGMAVRDNLPLMFASALGLDPVKFVTAGYLKYDISLQRELETETESIGGNLEELQFEVDDEADRASRANRWKWIVKLDRDYDESIFVSEVNLIVYALLPEEINVGDNFREINSVFEDYIDKFSLPYINDIIEPEEISVFAAGEHEGSTFESPYVVILYPNLQEMARERGEPFEIAAIGQDLESLDESSRNGGMSIALATDPYVEDGFDVIASKIAGIRGFIDDSDFYLEQVVTAYAAERYKEWEEVSQEYDYVGGLEIQTEATFTSTLSIDLSVLQERGGYTPKQAAALLIMLGEDETLQRFLINEINKECQIAYGDADSWNGMAISFTITGPDNYSSIEEIFEDDPDGEVDDSFDLRMELDQDDVRTKGEKFALAALLEQYDEAEMAELILAFSEPLKAKMQELVPPEPTNENKKRMKVRMIRG